MKPLEGVKVVELATYLAAPAVPRLLGDWGADVIKVENFAGDEMRYMASSFNMTDQSKDEFNPCFDICNFNKKFIALNLKNPEGMEAFHQLLKEADVFVTNWRIKALVKLGLDYDNMKVKYPQIIYGHLLGFGEKGPAKDNPGFDATAYAARGGLMVCFPQEGDEPANIPPAFGDHQASIALGAGICAALIKKLKTGLGDRVSVSIYNTAIYMMTIGLVSSQECYFNEYPKSRKQAASPFNNSFPTKDGWLQMCMPFYNASYNKIMKMIGREDLIDSPEFNDLEKVNKAGKLQDICEILEDGFRKKTSQEWLEIFKEYDVAGEKCYTFKDILKDEQAWANDYLRKVKYLDGKEVIHTSSPVKFDGMGLADMLPSRPLGYHTEEILVQFGYTKEQVDAMKQNGAAK